MELVASEPSEDVTAKPVVEALRNSVSSKLIKEQEKTLTPMNLTKDKPNVAHKINVK